MNDKFGAFAFCAFHGHAAAVPFHHDVIGNGQPQPRALSRRLSGKERLENTGLHVVWDARAVVLYFENYLARPSPLAP